jgi:hypothetical protein
MRNLILYSILILLNLQVFAQVDSLRYDKSILEVKQFNSKKLEEYKNDNNFQYEEVKHKKTFLDKVLEWIGNKFFKFLQWLFGERRAEGIFGFIVKFFPYFIAVLMVLLLLKIFLNIRTESIVTGTIKQSKIYIQNDEELIKNRDIGSLIDKALADKNYRLAIRYHYLNILQSLEKKEIIIWEQQKTNHDYEREINAPKLQHLFKDLTYLYDFVWYGNFDINKTEFEKAAQLFQNMEKEI